MGDTLTETNGSWSNGPTAFAYQWEDCDVMGGNCTAIAGATGQTYMLAATDAGHTIRAVETVGNSDGAATAASDPTAPVATSAAPAPHVVTQAPVTLTTTQTAGKKSGEFDLDSGGDRRRDRSGDADRDQRRPATGSSQYGLYAKASCVASSAVFHSPTQTVSGSAAPGLLAGDHGARRGHLLLAGDLRRRSGQPAGGQPVRVRGADRDAGGTRRVHRDSDPTAVKLKVGCAIVPCTLRLTLTATEKVEIPAIVARKTKKRRFRTERVTICSDAVHIIRSGDVAVDAKLTKQGKQYLHKRHGHVKLKLTLTETIKGTKLVTERTVNVGIAKAPASTPKQPTGAGASKVRPRPVGRRPGG